jgi:hypothetical protein
VADSESLQGSVQSLNGENGAGNAKIGLAGDSWGSTKICGSSNTLKDGGESDEGVQVKRSKVVGAWSDRGDSSCCEGSGEGGDMSFLISSDVLNVLVVGSAEVSGGKGRLGDGCQGLLVEGKFKMLKL